MSCMLRKPERSFASQHRVCCTVWRGCRNSSWSANQSPAASAYVQLAVLAVMLFTNMVMRLRFPYAVATSVIMLSGDCYFFAGSRCYGRGEKIFGIGLAHLHYGTDDARGQLQRMQGGATELPAESARTSCWWKT